MAAFGAGDYQAVETVFDRLGPSIRALARRIVGEAGADDVVQETFERMWRHAHRFDPERGSLEAWAFTIARNAALGQLRRTRHHEPLRTEAPDPSLNPAEEVERAEVRSAVRAAVRTLPGDRRLSIEQVLAGSTLVEAARRLGVPEGTLKSRVRAAHSDLRLALVRLLA